MHQRGRANWSQSAPVWGSWGVSRVGSRAGLLQGFGISCSCSSVLLWRLWISGYSRSHDRAALYLFLLERCVFILQIFPLFPSLHHDSISSLPFPPSSSSFLWSLLMEELHCTVQMSKVSKKKKEYNFLKITVLKEMLWRNKPMLIRSSSGSLSCQKGTKLIWFF